MRHDLSAVRNIQEDNVSAGPFWEAAVTRERQLTDAFAELTDTLVGDFDVVDLLHQLTVRCVRLLDVDAAGLLLADRQGRLRPMAASTEQARILKLLQLQDVDGPGLDCYRTGEPVTSADLIAGEGAGPVSPQRRSSPASSRSRHCRCATATGSSAHSPCYGRQPAD
ncbi:hypothetical protein GCM10027612_02160 [Microbispora bryophytorum subsp. camponoti]